MTTDQKLDLVLQLLAQTKGVTELNSATIQQVSGHMDHFLSRYDERLRQLHRWKEKYQAEAAAHDKTKKQYAAAQKWVNQYRKQLETLGHQSAAKSNQR